MSDKSQMFSMDAVMAVALFFISGLVILSVLTTDNLVKIGALQRDAELISRCCGPEDPETQFLSGSTVDESRFLSLRSEDYGALRSRLGVRNDFCIHFQDEEGNIIYMNGTKASLGSDKITLSGTPCGQ